MAYSAKVVDAVEGVLQSAISNNPGNVGSFDKSDKNIGTGLVGAPACGDVMKLQIKVSKDGTIEDVKFKTFGCGSAIASSNYACDVIKGKNLDDAMQITNEQISQSLSLPPVKRHCSLLAEDAIKAAIEDYKNKQKSA
jgi:nitrogen fixation protein NifU and related proteins